MDDFNEMVVAAKVARLTKRVAISALASGYANALHSQGMDEMEAATLAVQWAEEREDMAISIATDALESIMFPTPADTPADAAAAASTDRGQA